MSLPEQNKIPEGSHGTKTASLCGESDEKPDGQRKNHRGVHGARSFEAVKQNLAFCLILYLGISKH